MLLLLLLSPMLLLMLFSLCAERQTFATLKIIMRKRNGWRRGTSTLTALSQRIHLHNKKINKWEKVKRRLRRRRPPQRRRRKFPTAYAQAESKENARETLTKRGKIDDIQMKTHHPYPVKSKPHPAHSSPCSSSFFLSFFLIFMYTDAHTTRTTPSTPLPLSPTRTITSTNANEKRK